jgi:hypothetical protein
MPIVAVSNGIKPYIRALAVIKLNKPVSPKEINDCVGTGDYASKYISKLRKDGFEFTIERDGRTIITYTLISEPNCAEAYRAMKPKEKGVKSAKVAKATNPSKKAKSDKSGVKTSEQIKAANLAKMKKVSAKLAAKKKKTKKIIDYVERELGSTGEIATSFNIDPAWDSMDGVDVKSLVTAI